MKGQCMSGAMGAANEASKARRAPAWLGERFLNNGTDLQRYSCPLPLPPLFPPRTHCDPSPTTARVLWLRVQSLRAKSGVPEASFETPGGMAIRTLLAEEAQLLHLVGHMITQ